MLRPPTDHAAGLLERRHLNTFAIRYEGFGLEVREDSEDDNPSKHNSTEYLIERDLTEADSF